MTEIARTQAICLILRREGRYLMGKRAEWKRSAPGFWCPISGRIEPGESEEQACLREALEEVGVRVSLIRKLTVMVSRNGHADLHWWFGEITEGEPHLACDENSALGWFSLEELRTLQPSFEEDLSLMENLEAELN